MAINIVSPENVEYILKTNFDNYVKGGLGELLDDFLGRGIFRVDGEEWRKTRKVASHMFTSRLLKTDIFQVFVEHGSQVLQILSRIADKPDQSIDMQSLFYRFTMDSMIHAAFGVRVHTLQAPHPFSQAFDK